MSAKFAPFGLMPTLHQSGTIRPSPTPGTFASGHAENIFQYSPVYIDTSGLIALAAAGGGSPATQRLIGCFMGVEYTFTGTGRRVVSNYWPTGTVATNIVVWYMRDAYVTYRIQANGPITQAEMGNQASYTLNDSTAGNTTTGFSTVALDTATLSHATNANQLRITGFDQSIDNAIGDAFTIVQVQIALHQDVANQVPYGGA